MTPAAAPLLTIDVTQLVAIVASILIALGGGIIGSARLFVRYLDRRDEAERKVVNAVFELQRDTIKALGGMQATLEVICRRLGEEEDGE